MLPVSVNHCCLRIMVDVISDNNSEEIKGGVRLDYFETAEIEKKVPNVGESDRSAK